MFVTVRYFGFLFRTVPFRGLGWGLRQVVGNTRPIMGRFRWCRTGPAHAAPGGWRPPRGRWRWYLGIEVEIWSCLATFTIAEMFCILSLTVNSPVPKPSMPGMSSPNLKEHHRLHIKTCIHLFSLFCKTWRRKSFSRDVPLNSFLWRLTLELSGLPLLELGRALARSGRASGYTGGWFDFSFGWLKIHFEHSERTCAGKSLGFSEVKLLWWNLWKQNSCYDLTKSVTSVFFPASKSSLIWCKIYCHLCLTLSALILLWIWRFPVTESHWGSTLQPVHQRRPNFL